MSILNDFTTKFSSWIKGDREKGVPISGISESSGKVDYILEEFQNALDFEQENIERMDESWRLFSGFKNGQWPADAVAKLEAEGRNPFQGNFIKQKVWGLAGSLIKNFFDVSFEPVEGSYSDLTKIVKYLMHIDKELMNWNASYKDLVIDGLTFLGVEEMYVSQRYNDLGNIGFRRVMPGHIILDPHWISNDAWDLRKAWKASYLTPKEIKEIYNTKGREIDDFVRMRAGHATEFDNGATNRGFPHFNLEESYNDKYRVLEYHHMEREKKKIQISIDSGLALPEADDDYIKEWAVLNGVNLDEGVITKEVDLDVYYVTTICPTLSRSLILEDNKSLIQIGRLPFFPWSCYRINGTNSGIPELLKSVQQTYNKRESLLDDMISRSANGGMAMDPAIVDNDDYKKEMIEKNWNKTSFKFWTEAGALASGREYFKELPRAQMDYGVVNELNRMVDMADRISGQPAAMDARSEGSEESGILFARKQLQAEVTMTVLMKGLEQHWNDKGEAYLLLAKDLYGGVYRQFNILGENETMELNKPELAQDGTLQIKNDISMLPRMKVVISQSPEGVTTRATDRAINVEILRVIGPENPISRAQAVKNVMKTLDGSKQERAQMEEAADIEKQLARERALTELLNLKATQMQIQMQLQAAMQPQLPGIQQAPEQKGEAPRGPGNPAQEPTGQDMQMASQQIA